MGSRTLLDDGLIQTIDVGREEGTPIFLERRKSIFDTIYGTSKKEGG
jgi:hypothetical protein